MKTTPDTPDTLYAVAGPTGQLWVRMSPPMPQDRCFHLATAGMPFMTVGEEGGEHANSPFLPALGAIGFLERALILSPQVPTMTTVGMAEGDVRAWVAEIRGHQDSIAIAVLSAGNMPSLN